MCWSLDSLRSICILLILVMFQFGIDCRNLVLIVPVIFFILNDLLIFLFIASVIMFSMHGKNKKIKKSPYQNDVRLV